MLAALTFTGKIYKRQFAGSINAEKVLVGLDHLRRHIRKPFILIWDRSRAHRSMLVKGYLVLYGPPLAYYAARINAG